MSAFCHDESFNSVTAVAVDRDFRHTPSEMLDCAFLFVSQFLCGLGASRKTMPQKVTLRPTTFAAFIPAFDALPQWKPESLITSGQRENCYNLPSGVLFRRQENPPSRGLLAFLIICVGRRLSWRNREDCPDAIAHYTRFPASEVFPEKKYSTWQPQQN
jgi:hypothetical protein